MPDRLTWIGHATALIQTGGARLLTDPVMRLRVAHLRRHSPAPRPLGRIDGVLISHAHRDHLDIPSLRTLQPGTPVLAPAGAARVLRRAGIAARVVHPGDRLQLAGVPVEVVLADHDGRRSPASAPSPAVGFLIGAEHPVWFAGDTGLFDAMGDLAGRVHTALVPIWGWGTGLGPGHMDPEQAAHAVALVAPQVAIPVHWGTFLPAGMHGRHAHLLSEPAERFAVAVARVAPGVRTEIIQPGESASVG